VRGNPATVQALIDAGADVNAQTNDGFTPLMVAAFQGHKDIVQLLVREGADVNATAACGANAFMIAIWKEYHPIARFLHDHGAYANLPNVGSIAAQSSAPYTVPGSQTQGIQTTNGWVLPSGSGPDGYPGPSDANPGINALQEKVDRVIEWSKSREAIPSQQQGTGRLVRKRVLVKDWDFDEDGNRHWGDYHYEYRWVRE
jgi:ankyrin repeat protein